MASPFPGMNPYLEQEIVWQDFHQSFIPAARGFLRETLPKGYFVKVEELVFVHEIREGPTRATGRADLAVTRPSRPRIVGAATALAEAPTLGRLVPSIDEERHSYLEILTKETLEVVAIIELLSPSNKASGSDRDQYLAKRKQILSSPVHLVEIDLLRGGPRLPVEELPPCDYCILVSQVEGRPDVGIWPLSLREPLPAVPVPLRPHDPPARLDLKRILDFVYDQAGYEDYLYRTPPRPRLSAADARWARQFLPSTAS